MDLFWTYFDANTTKKYAKDFGNVIHPSVFADNVDNSTLVVLLVPPPELHLLLGPVNVLYDELTKVWPAVGESWSEKLHIKREEYHRGQFNGNDCRKLLKNVQLLKDCCPEKYGKFLEAFSGFNEVVTACYGTDLAPDYKQKINHFKSTYRKLGISTTPKVHAVFYHIIEFCQLMKKGLSPWR